jgi:hypothetical protein
MKDEKAAARDGNKKISARNMYIYICLQFEELFSHLPVLVLLRQSILPTHSGSTSEHLVVSFQSVLLVSIIF